MTEMISEDDFPMIEVKKMNETEVRLFALLFNLLKEPKGISFQRFRKIMPRYYHNEDIDSDRKKLYRDLGQLKSMGFNIKVANFGFQSEDHFPYYLEKESLESVLKFSKEELEFLSYKLCEVENQDNEVLLSLSQKLFSKNLDLYPKGIKINKRKKESDTNEDSDLLKIIQSIKDKRALVIRYGKDGKERIIEPYRLIRKNSEDFYLLAYDRTRKNLRRFILPRIEVKKDLREDFISNKKISDRDTNFHPLGFDVHDEERLQFSVANHYIDSLETFLNGYQYSLEENTFTILTTNRSALFPFFTKYPDALQISSENPFSAYFQNHIKQILETYKSVA
ncbi:helix-turn-helix transcriptional regulator [Leptospira sp. 'Mane']|uniref:helix-turn-helix transcriptional regulator n=1 Tax=Leptospira sp. 'Mane' TaxID=3387407 RepID=UPI00398B1CCF